MATFDHNKLREKSIQSNYEEAKKDTMFKKIAASLDVSDKELIFNTSKTEFTSPNSFNLA